MYSKELEEIIDAALADGVLTEKEKSVLMKRAIAEGIDADEFEVVLEGRLVKMTKTQDWLRPAPPQNLQNEKLGNVVKCPSCGAQVIGGSAVCNECGYTFSNVNANSSAQRLADKLEEIDKAYRDKVEFSIPLYGVSKRAKEKASIIRAFPVPNTRADLLEFLASMSAQLASMKTLTTFQVADHQTLLKAYESKYQECKNKAQISFANDPDFQQYLVKKSFFSKIFGK